MRNTISLFLADIFKMRKIIFNLAKRDFQQEYKGSILGIVWVFLQPLLFITVLYTVFTLGIRAGKSTDTIFSIYLISGLIVWQYFSGLLSSSSEVIKKFSYLVKKVDFKLSVLPVVKILSQLILHAFLISVAIIFAWVEGYPPSIYTLQLLYYLFSVSVLLIGLGWLTSSTSIFISDVSKFIKIVVQFGFWLTPILWEISRVPEQYQWIIKLNPLVYITEGYRDSITGQAWFWEKPFDTLTFWAFTLFFCYAGINTFRKLRPHFAEVI